MILVDTPITTIESDVPIESLEPSRVRIVCKLCSAVIMEVIVAEVEDHTFESRMHRDVPARMLAHFGSVHGMDVS